MNPLLTLAVAFTFYSAQFPLTAAAAASVWTPAAGTTWEIILSRTATASDASLPVSVLDLDLEDNTASTITALHAAGKKVICYFSAGSYEDWRSDASEFTTADYGSPLDGWDGEWWLDVNSANVRRIMAARLDTAVTKGCDGVDPDNVDAYSNDNGLGLTQDDAAAYVRWLAEQGHKRGLAVGLKNGGEIVDRVLDAVQWEVNEQCVEQGECELYRPFIDAGKPVFGIEYPESAPDVSSSQKSKICGDATRDGFSTLLKEMDLSAWSSAC
ncbi:glycoside hydrolase superfamily [Geopyxis carbonaria]|nr:glycoside hydrolase superfamily [Geopyxis carbonaria]